MATTTIRITHTKDSASLGAVGRVQGQETTNSREVCLRLAELFTRIAAGMEPATVEVQAGGTTGAAATGTLTISSGSGSVGGTIAGTSKTVTWATDDTTTATALATAINADTTIKKLVTATSAAGVVTLTSKDKSYAASQITLTASGTGVTAGGLTGGKLTGGAGDDVAPVVYTRS